MPFSDMWPRGETVVYRRRLMASSTSFAAAALMFATRERHAALACWSILTTVLSVAFWHFYTPALRVVDMANAGGVLVAHYAYLWQRPWTVATAVAVGLNVLSLVLCALGWRMDARQGHRLHVGFHVLGGTSLAVVYGWC